MKRALVIAVVTLIVVPIVALIGAKIHYHTSAEQLAEADSMAQKYYASIDRVDQAPKAMWEQLDAISKIKDKDFYTLPESIDAANKCPGIDVATLEPEQARWDRAWKSGKPLAGMPPDQLIVWVDRNSGRILNMKNSRSMSLFWNLSAVLDYRKDDKARAMQKFDASLNLVQALDSTPALIIAMVAVGIEAKTYMTALNVMPIMDEADLQNLRNKVAALPDPMTNFVESVGVEGATAYRTYRNLDLEEAGFDGITATVIRMSGYLNNQAVKFAKFYGRAIDEIQTWQANDYQGDLPDFKAIARAIDGSMVDMVPEVDRLAQQIHKQVIWRKNVLDTIDYLLKNKIPAGETVTLPFDYEYEFSISADKGCMQKK